MTQALHLLTSRSANGVLSALAAVHAWLRASQLLVQLGRAQRDVISWTAAQGACAAAKAWTWTFSLLRRRLRPL